MNDSETLRQEIQDAAHDALKKTDEGCFPEERIPDCVTLGAELAPLVERRIAEAVAETVMGGQRFAVVWALREAAAAWRINGLAWGDPDEETNTDLLVARKLDERADRIERGEKP